MTGDRGRAADYLSVGDMRLAYAVHGAASGPWVVMSSALGTDSRLWRQQLPALVKDFRVLVYDHRGHGRSSAGSRGTAWTMELMVGDVVALLDALDIDSAAFVGLSLGGAVGLGVALSQPQRLTSLMCCCARADAPEAYRALWYERAECVERAGVDGIIAPTLGRWFADDPRHPDDRLVADAMAMLQATSRKGYIGAATALTTLDYRERLGEIRLPTLFLAGERDKAIPVEVVREMSERTPGSRFASIADAAHLANVERPAAFNEALTSWLRSAA